MLLKNKLGKSDNTLKRGQTFTERNSPRLFSPINLFAKTLREISRWKLWQKLYTSFYSLYWLSVYDTFCLKLKQKNARMIWNKQLSCIENWTDGGELQTQTRQRSCLNVFCRKDILTQFWILTGKNLQLSLFLNKIANVIYSKKRLNRYNDAILWVFQNSLEHSL